MEKRKVEIYKIKNVDTLSTISKSFNINPTELLVTNEISPKQIYEGNVVFFKKYRAKK